MKHLIKIYIVAFILTITAIGYLYFSLLTTQEQLTANINQLFLSQTKEFTENVKENIALHVKHNLYETLKNNPSLRNKIEENIATIATNTYKFVYVLYRDEQGNYRYLLDGSKEERGEFDEKLNVNKKLWDSVYSKQKPKIFYQKNLDGLWGTYLAPLVYDGKTKAVIAMDFSATLPQNIATAMEPLNRIFLYIFGAIAIMLLVLAYQTFLNLKIKKDAITDELTQAYNRNYLRDFLQEINISKYQIIILDIDHFKYVNDTYGHKVGDDILRAVSKLIKREIREEDKLIRFGGEEFLLFIHRKESSEKLAYSVAQRIRQKIEQTLFRSGDIEIYITVSMGISCSPERFKTVSDAIKHADKMLYIAKREGRNQVVTQDLLEQEPKELQKRITIHEITESINEGRLLCYFQAIFDASSKKILKYEALARLETKEGKILPPMEFIPNILYTNLYNQMTKQIIEIVFKNIAKYQVPISVNLNFSDIINKDIFQLIVDALQKNKELAPWLIIELLEYEPLDGEKATVMQNITYIKSYGVKIAIDDFGAGYANYDIFQMLPIDIIKIDGSLIKNIDNSTISYTVVKSILLLTKELGIQTVAEFVHSQDVFEIVRSLGVDSVQGYYLAQPQPSLQGV